MLKILKICVKKILVLKNNPPEYKYLVTIGWMNRRIITINISVSIICSSSSIVKFWLCVFMSRVSRNCSFKIRRMKSQTLILIVRISRFFRCVSVYGVSRNVSQTYCCTSIFSGLQPLFLNLVFEKFILIFVL